MIEDKELDIEEINADVRLITDEDLWLKNSSVPRLYTGESFRDAVKGEVQRIRKSLDKTEEKDLERKGRLIDKIERYLNENAKVARAGMPLAFLDNELVKHLNDFGRTWNAASIANLELYAFFLEKTKLGKQLLELGDTDLLDERYPYLGGAAGWVGIYVMDRLKAKGYNSDLVIPEIANSLKSGRRHRGYEICRRLWEGANESARRGELNSLTPQPKPSRIIAAGILYASSLSEDFNEAFLELGHMPITDIFYKSDLYGMIANKKLSPEEIGILIGHIRDVGSKLGTEKQVGDIREPLKRLGESSLHIAGDRDNYLKEMGETALDFHKTIVGYESTLGLDKFRDSGAYRALRDFLRDFEGSLESYK